MSGGHFDYNQYRIAEIADEIQHLINSNGEENKWGNARNYPDEIISQFKTAIHYLRLAQIYAHRIDWLVSADDGEETFIERLREETLAYIVENSSPSSIPNSV